MKYNRFGKCIVTLLKEKISIRMDFEGKEAQEFDKVREKLGVRAYAEAIRVLIRREAEA